LLRFSACPSILDRSACRAIPKAQPAFFFCRVPPHHFSGRFDTIRQIHRIPKLHGPIFSYRRHCPEPQPGLRHIQNRPRVAIRHLDERNPVHCIARFLPSFCIPLYIHCLHAIHAIIPRLLRFLQELQIVSFLTKSTTLFRSLQSGPFPSAYSNSCTFLHRPWHRAHHHFRPAGNLLPSPAGSLAAPIPPPCVVSRSPRPFHTKDLGKGSPPRFPRRHTPSAR